MLRARAAFAAIVLILSLTFASTAADTAPLITVPSDITVAEDVGKVTLTLSKDAPAFDYSEVWVNSSDINQSAMATRDFVPFSHNVDFDNKEVTRTFTFAILNRHGTAQNRSFIIKFKSQRYANLSALQTVVNITSVPAPPPVVSQLQPPLSAPKTLLNYTGQPVVVTGSDGTTWGMVECPDESIRYSTETCPTLTPVPLPTPPAAGWTQAAVGSSNNGIVKGGTALATQDCQGFYATIAFTGQAVNQIVYSGVTKGIVYKVLSPWGYYGANDIVTVLQNPTGGQAITVERSCLVGVS